MNATEIEIIENKLTHVTYRPTFSKISEINIFLMSKGYKDIPKINHYKKSDKFGNSYDIKEYIEDIRELMKNGSHKISKPKIEDTVYRFDEYELLPNNMFFKENNTEKNQQGDVDFNENSSVSDSEESDSSEKDYEEGYEYYDSGQEEFSD